MDEEKNNPKNKRERPNIKEIKKNSKSNSLAKFIIEGDDYLKRNGFNWRRKMRPSKRAAMKRFGELKKLKEKKLKEYRRK